MTETKPIRTALISTFNKGELLEQIISRLAAQGVALISTGGTRSFIEGCGYECAAVEDLTGYPPILGGRVKTLHPKVFGAILNRRDDADHRRDVTRYGIPDVDLVIVDLYPFEKTVAEPGSTEADIIEKIDIGGISLIRAAAKNYADVAIVASEGQYAELLGILSAQGAVTTLEQRRHLAMEAFAVSSGYDSAIFNWFAVAADGGQLPECLRKAVDGRTPLRYGENPHQPACFYGNLDALFEQLHGKELSYNNLLDVDAALGLIGEFAAGDSCACAVVKHNNPCGVALRPTAAEAWADALAGDPQSAFGGIICFNCPVDAATAAELDKIFFEVVIAPAYTDEALDTLHHKKNRIILRLKGAWSGPKRRLRTCLDGVLAQEADDRAAANETWEPMTEAVPTAAQMADLEMAERIVKHCKSNAIVLVNNRQLIGSGVGQTSRVDAVRHAIEKARAFSLPLEGSALASDAFFPFADSVGLAQAAGVAAIVQPGGSVRDAESVDFCNAHALPMMKTSTRHFRH